MFEFVKTVELLKLLVIYEPPLFTPLDSILKITPALQQTTSSSLPSDQPTSAVCPTQSVPCWPFFLQPPKLASTHAEHTTEPGL